MDETTFTGPGASAEVVESRRTSFGAGADDYAQVRPPWPAGTVDWLLGTPDAPLRVVDLGAGTGLGTRTVAELGHEVVAVDPSAGMLEALRSAARRLPSEVAHRISVHEGPAEDLAAADASVDAVTSFQAWHWFDESRAAAECARVTRPGGSLGLAWHSWSPDVAWLKELADVVGQPEMATAHDDLTPPALDGYLPAEVGRFPLDQPLTVEDLVRLAGTWSNVAVDPDRDRVLGRVRDLGTEVAGEDGRLVFSYVSECFRFRRV